MSAGAGRIWLPLRLRRRPTVRPGQRQQVLPLHHLVHLRQERLVPLCRALPKDGCIVVVSLGYARLSPERKELFRPSFADEVRLVLDEIG